MSLFSCKSSWYYWHFSFSLQAGYGLSAAWEISSLIPKHCKACNVMYPKGVPDVITNSTTSTCPETFFEIRAKILITGKDLWSMYASLVQPIQLGSYKVIAEDEKRDKSEWKVSRFCAIHEATSFEHCWSQESNPVELFPTPGNIEATRILSSPSSAATGLHSIQQSIVLFHLSVATLAFVFFYHVWTVNIIPMISTNFKSAIAKSVTLKPVNYTSCTYLIVWTQTISTQQTLISSDWLL